MPRAGIPARLLIALFLAALAAPTLDHFLRPPELREPRGEERNPAPFPVLEWSWAACDAFPAAFAKYFNDSLGWRDRLLCWNSQQELELFDKFPSNAMYTGRDGWWFYAEDDSIRALRGLRPFSELELESWRRALEAQRDFLRARGIEFLFVIAPNKETIYPEHLPSRFDRVGPTRLEQFAEYMHAHSDVAWLDLRPALLQAKADDRGDDLLYYPLGTHWTERGMWVGYREILRALAARLPCLVPPELADFSVTRSPNQADSWAGRAYVPGLYTQASYEYEPRGGFRAVVTRRAEDSEQHTWRERKGAGCASALFLHDSFGFKIDCLLAEHFERQVQGWQLTLDEQLVDENAPQVVIELFVERKLLQAPMRLVRTQKQAANRADFEAAAASLYVWDGSGGSAELASLDGAQLRADPARAGALITNSSIAQTFLTPPLPFPASGPSVLELELDSETAQTLDVLYLRKGDLDYHRTRSFPIVLSAGANRIYQRFEDPELTGRLRIRPRAAGTLALRRIELRAVRDG